MTRAIVRGSLKVSATWLTQSSSTVLYIHSGSIIKNMRLDHKPNSVSAKGRIMAIHLVLTSRSGSCDLPIRNVRTTLDCLVLLQAGFTRLPMFPRTPVVSYTTLSPVSNPPNSGLDVYFLLHLPFPSSDRTLLFRGALSCGVRTFLPSAYWRKSGHFTNLNYSSTPSQNCNTLQLGHLIIFLFSFISITI